MSLHLDTAIALAAAAVLLGAAAVVYLLRPLFDELNRLVRRVGLSGASPETRALGCHVEGRVVGRFRPLPGGEEAVGRVFARGETWNACCPVSVAADLDDGDPVWIEYADHLRVVVLGKRTGSSDRRAETQLRDRDGGSG